VRATSAAALRASREASMSPPRRALASVAALIGEPTRAAMLLALLDGRARPAGELAAAAGLSAPATSLHLAKLVSGGLLAVRQEGRHRYYRLASAEVGRALEALGALSTAPAPITSSTGAPLRSLPGLPLGSPQHRAFCAARTCFDHLAGALAIELAALLERQRVVRVVDEQTYELLAGGAAWLAARLQLDRAALAALAAQRRPLARRCLDWTERRPHLAGSLGAAVLDRFLASRWLVPVAGSRALRVSALGKARIAGLGIPAAALVSSGGRRT
jgi:DNA-binding transcriptional ArsR family regulator